MKLYLLLISAVLVTLAASASGAIKTEEVTYTADGDTLKGYLAVDDAIEGKRPAVLGVHEWWGHDQHARNRADALAKLGYTALAVDMYGEGKTADHPQQAQEFADAVRTNPEMAKKRFMAALDFVKAHPTVNSEEIAAIGYCFGGAVVLNMARQGVDLDGVVSFHGALATDTPAKKGDVKAKVLVLHGAEDKFIPEEQVAAFKKEMEEAGVDYEFVSYPGATHSFTNPKADELGKKFDLPLAYDKETDEASWAKMKQFLEKIFAGESDAP